MRSEHIFALIKEREATGALALRPVFEYGVLTIQHVNESAQAAIEEERRALGRRLADGEITSQDMLHQLQQLQYQEPHASSPLGAAFCDQVTGGAYVCSTNFGVELPITHEGYLDAFCYAAGQLSTLGWSHVPITIPYQFTARENRTQHVFRRLIRFGAEEGH